MPQEHSCPWGPTGDQFQDSLQIPKPGDAQDHSIICPRSIHTVGPLHSWFPTTDQKYCFRSAVGWTCRCETQRADHIYWKKLCTSGLVKFKSLLFKGQQYIQLTYSVWMISCFISGIWKCPLYTVNAGTMFKVKL